MSTINVLDIDLDFFLHTTSRPRKSDLREDLNDEVWKETDVRFFLENNCGLTRNPKPHGKQFIHHHEVYRFCKSLKANNPQASFHFDHVDAHADLGICDPKVITIFTDPNLLECGNWITEEDEIKYNLDPGNFLLFFLAQGWLTSLTYINQSHLLKSDINKIVLSERSDIHSGIHMKYFETIGNIQYQEKGFSRSSIVPFNLIDYRQFINCHLYDYVFLTQSPDYCPIDSDSLLPIISEYFQEI